MKIAAVSRLIITIIRPSLLYFYNSFTLAACSLSIDFFDHLYNRPNPPHFVLPYFYHSMQMTFLKRRQRLVYVDQMYIRTTL